ncbi:THO complex subunit 1 transcription elongation factor-domain-containing protein [Chaetomium fimeti]|uniref:THO complex subunit 1 transcription elongation factor-domain-containing protein n=1 Tax=Chaetomium fimeti TaxID=1854472 RepID=A0AAE0LTJ4_9PEZI|nr:THO complex subunit 1 transcription elongation factor-domain-containing protein [Chaetomium fimeti]
MPSATIDSHGVSGVAAAGAFLDNLLARAEIVKQTASIEPPLEKSDFDDVRRQLSDALSYEFVADEPVDAKKIQRFAVIETAARDTFKSLIAMTPIESPAFVKVWNLLDILSLLSDLELCDPALLFWLVEELLDSQTIAGCRKVFDFLESRRERITAKHFKQKQLVILRTCNELLRRLSRALDPAFCGRVFIFMFQSFPLGDKSSVNLRGEYHVENVTTFDQETPVVDAEKMDVDTDSKPQKDKPLDPDSLYPIFWSLQESFNQPKKLFESSHFAAFKAGLEATMATFWTINPEKPTRKEKDKPEEEMNPSHKRKRDDVDDELASGFNPKYLTSRDLFKLEISDLAFRRNFLVQVLIVMEFLLSLSPKAKEKLAAIKAPNKSVTYSDQQLSEEDTKWATNMRADVVRYLQKGVDGPFFDRMVGTVLVRDKNWVRWKVENCPSIELPTLSPGTFIEARAAATRLARTRRLPNESRSLEFLGDEDEKSAMERLKNPERYSLPELTSFKDAIDDDDFDIERATSNESKASAIESKASKAWRTLRIASKSKLVVFDKIEDDEKIDIVFKDHPIQEAGVEEDAASSETVFPEDRRAIAIVDATSSPGARSELVKQFIAEHSRVFTRVSPHVIREPQEGEVKGQDYHFVDVQAFNVMRDGDLFIEFNEEGDNVHGTNKRMVEAIIENDRVPVMEMDRDGAQQVKDNGFDARFVLVEGAEAEVDTTTLEFYDSVVKDLDSLKGAIFGPESEAPAASGDGDTPMADEAAP